MESVSVIIPVRNRAELVQETLASIFSQTASDFELILIDNDSSDGTPEVLRRWAEKFKTDRNIRCKVGSCSRPTASAPRNAGLKMAESPFVLFFDSDDLMDRDHIQRVINAIKETPDVDLFGWNVTYCFPDGKTRKGEFFAHDLQWHNLFHGSMATLRWAARRQLVIDAGGWNESVPRWNDIELGARILSLSPKIRHLGNSGLSIRYQPQSITANLSADPQRIEPSLISIASTLGKRGRSWCNLKRAIEYGNFDKNATSDIATEGRPLKISEFTLAERIAYRLTRAGIPGAARLLRLLYL